ncbi:MAG: hypothetical protein KDA63_18690 [Planctomycetales bacterium]|nr:hypothetical protein [Planctomycetales bacterium]
MIDWIISRTPKQWAIGYFAFGALFGSALASAFLVVTWDVASQDRLLMLTSVLGAALVFTYGVLFGAIPGGICLVWHYWMKRSGEESFWVSPWASETVKEIQRHLTATEKRQFVRHSALFGAWGAATFAAPLSLLTLDHSASSIYRTTLLVCISSVSTIWIRKWQRSLLASTAYAQQQGIKAEDIDLRLWRRKRRR